MTWSRQRVDLTGQRFGRLTVLHKSKSRNRHTRWTVLCDCGKKKTVNTTALKRCETRSCGCLRKENAGGYNFKHGSSSNRLWRIWRGVCARAPVIDAAVLALYRGPGTMDPEWRDFGAFTAWAASSGYEPDLTIDRVDNSIGYWPANCRWATNLQQQNNRTCNVRLTVAGRSYTLTEAWRTFGARPETIKKRLALGIAPEEAVLPGYRKRAA